MIVRLIEALKSWITGKKGASTLLTTTAETRTFDHPIGSRVIVIDNEDNPYWVGTVVAYEKIHNRYIPIVKNSKGACFSSLSILRRYSMELCSKLDRLNNIEQWNFVAHDHAQISHKYGKEYVTYTCQCFECVRQRYFSQSIDQ